MEQSAGRCHFVAVAVDIQETAEDRTVCSKVSIAPAASDTLFYDRAARTSFRFLPGAATFHFGTSLISPKLIELET